MHNKISKLFTLLKGYDKDVEISPTLFKICLQYTLMNCKSKSSQMGLLLTDETIYSLLYADNQLITTE